MINFTLRPLYPREEQRYRLNRWLRHSADLDGVEEIINSCPYEDLNRGLSSP